MKLLLLYNRVWWFFTITLGSLGVGLFFYLLWILEWRPTSALFLPMVVHGASYASPLFACWIAEAVARARNTEDSEDRFLVVGPRPKWPLWLALGALVCSYLTIVFFLSDSLGSRSTGLGYFIFWPMYFVLSMVLRATWLYLSFETATRIGFLRLRENKKGQVLVLERLRSEGVLDVSGIDGERGLVYVPAGEQGRWRMLFPKERSAEFVESLLSNKRPEEGVCVDATYHAPPERSRIWYFAGATFLAAAVLVALPAAGTFAAAAAAARDVILYGVAPMLLGFLPLGYLVFERHRLYRHFAESGRLIVGGRGVTWEAISRIRTIWPLATIESFRVVRDGSNVLILLNTFKDRWSHVFEFGGDSEQFEERLRQIAPEHGSARLAVRRRGSNFSFVVSIVGALWMAAAGVVYNLNRLFYKPFGVDLLSLGVTPLVLLALFLPGVFFVSSWLLGRIQVLVIEPGTVRFGRRPSIPIEKVSIEMFSNDTFSLSWLEDSRTVRLNLKGVFPTVGETQAQIVATLLRAHSQPTKGGVYRSLGNPQGNR